MPYYKILVGVLIGLAVGAVNFYLMRVFIRLALKNAGHVWGVLVIILSYALRYLLIGLVVFWLMRRNEQMVALIVLAVLGALTMLLAVLQQKRKSGAGR
jgi:hypothetical protein